MATTATKGVNWAVEVASRIRGIEFPLGEDVARNKLKGITVGGRDIDELIDNIAFPVPSAAGLLHQISAQTKVAGPKGP
jgi:predicted transcriptional regulator